MPDGLLSGRVVVVTGAAEGIGRACARAFARAGATVVVADIKAEVGEAVAATIRATGAAASFHHTDVGDNGSCRALIEAVVAAHGRIDVLHANAGIELSKPILETTNADWHRVIAVNLTGAFVTAREAMRDMRRRKEPGVLLFTSSPHAFVTSQDIAAYAASKGGMVALMRAMALEGAPFGIRAAAILPGATDTPMLRREADHASDPGALLEQFRGAQPTGRLGTPEDVADVAVFLASDAARFVTGSCIAADGGLMAAINSGPVITYTG